MDANGSNQTRLTNSTLDFSPSISGDGSKIAFVSYRDGGNAEIYIMDADGSNQTRLTNNPADDFSPSISGDGSKIAFISDRDGGDEIYIMDANGSNQTRLTNNPADDSEPSFNGDGSKIAFTSNRDDPNNYEIYVMDANGSNQTPLTNNPALDFSPSFGGCPSTVLIGLEVTQGVQDLNNSVQLVEHKKTFVRAHVKNAFGRSNFGFRFADRKRHRYRRHPGNHPQQQCGRTNRNSTRSDPRNSQ